MKTLELETPTTQEQIKQPDRPRYDVPIMIEITQWDLDNAKDYCCPTGCLIHTCLQRNGFDVTSVGPSGVSFGAFRYQSDEIGPEMLLNYSFAAFLGFGEWGGYKKKLVGKQIILYPGNI